MTRSGFAGLREHACGRIQLFYKAMFNPQPLHYRPLESRANLFAD